MTTQQDSVDVERLQIALNHLGALLETAQQQLVLIESALSLPITQRDEQGGVWRGIADAPRDGTEIVGWDEASGTRHVTSWDHGRWHDPDSHYYSEAPVFEPTLFCTLPHLSIKQGDQDGGTSA